MMRRIFVIVVVMLASLVVPVGVALAQGTGPEPNAHNCGGTTSVGAKQLLGGGRELGDLVSDVAQVQLVDNFTQANCNQNSGQNP
jgi:hypothetical protein